MYRLLPKAARPQENISAPELNVNETKDANTKLVASAIAENRIKVAFQPVVSARNSKIPAFQEALVRIEDRNGDIIPAASFMTDVEDSDIGRLVDRAVLRRVISVLENNPRMRISVNLSAQGIGDLDWLNILKQACERAPQCGELLIVEITESSMLNLTPHALDFLYELRTLGCSIALDDFGAGHTSISHLGKFRFDFLKIDGSFLRNFSQNEDAQFLVKSMISIARHFEMVSVAEMVDNHEDASLLQQMGIDCMQGYFFGKPSLDPHWMKPKLKVVPNTDYSVSTS